MRGLPVACLNMRTQWKGLIALLDAEALARWPAMRPSLAMPCAWNATRCPAPDFASMRRNPEDGCGHCAYADTSRVNHWDQEQAYRADDSRIWRDPRFAVL